MNVRAELRAAIALVEVERLGPLRIRRFVDACGSARAAIDALARGRLPGLPDRDGRRGVGPDLRARLSTLRPVPDEALDELESGGIRVLARGLPGYPPRLDDLPDPPAVLWLRGPGSLPTERAVAVVGTRKATEYGRRVARDLGAGLARHGWTVVSGLASGIDGAAHRGALDAEGATVGVLGSGIEHRYPSSNAALYDRMETRGLLVSEFPPREGPRRGYFPRRNRVIAALCEGVVVVQAGEPSGALITADHALDLGREVLAVPGPVGTRGSAGVHGLIRDGAALVESAEDVLRTLGVEREDRSRPASAPAGAGESATGAAAAIWHGLGAGPRAADELAVAVGLPIGEALALLSRLEIEGSVRTLPGGRYERTSTRAVRAR